MVTVIAWVQMQYLFLLGFQYYCMLFIFQCITLIIYIVKCDTVCLLLVC